MKSSIDNNAEIIRNAGLNVKEEIFKFSKYTGITTALYTCGISGACGYSAALIFLVIFVAAFTNNNIYRTVVINSSRLISKDAAYDFLHSTSANWRLFLGIIAKKIIVFCHALTSRKHKKAIVFDDTSFKKNRSNKVELLSKCHDHVDNSYYKGFKNLNMVWTDGYTAIPLGYSLIASQYKNKRYNESTKDVDKRSNSYKRREEAINGKPKAVVNLIKFAQSKIFKLFDVILFDSWYVSNFLISSCSKIAPVVCMLKKNSGLKFYFNNRNYNVEGIYRNLKKKPGKSRIIGSVLCKLVYNEKNENNEKIIVKIVFIRHRKTGDWIPILSTQTKWSDEEIVKTYGMRWIIEVFHRDIKQFLNIETVCQSRDFDAIYGYIALSYIQYIFISYRKRLHDDDRGIGELFYCCCEEIEEISFNDAYANLIYDAIILLKSMSFEAKDENNQNKPCVELDVVENVLLKTIMSKISIANAIRFLITGLNGCINIESKLAERLESEAA